MKVLATDLQFCLDPVIFANSLGLTKPDSWQTRTLRWEGKRLLLNCHRQAGKSTTAALLALHFALYRPESLILLISPSLRQSSELFRKVGDWIDRLETKPEMPEDNRLSCTFPNGSRVVSLPSSESTVRGFSGVDMVVEDEASRVPDDLYCAIRPMLAVSGGRLVLMSTPFGKRGHFYEEWANGGDHWERIEIPATQNTRIPTGFLEEERWSLGDWWYRQEYLVEFLVPTDQVFSHELVMGAVSCDIHPLFGGAKP